MAINGELTDEEAAVIRFLGDFHSVTTDQVAERFGISGAEAATLMNSLVGKGILNRGSLTEPATYYPTRLGDEAIEVLRHFQ